MMKKRNILSSWYGQEYGVLEDNDIDNEFDPHRYYKDKAQMYENLHQYKQAVEYYELQIKFLVDLYNVNLKMHQDNLQYQTYNGKTFLQTAQRWKNKIIEVYNHILKIVNENRVMFSEFKEKTIDEILSDINS